MRTFIFGLVCTALFVCNHAYCEVRIATVDVNRILNESKEAKAAKSELDKASAEAKKKVETRRDTVKALEQKVKDGNLKEDSKEASQLRDQTKEYVRFVKDTEEELKSQFLKTNKALTDKTIKLVEQYAKSNDIDIVLDKSDKLRGPVLFRTPTLDITEEIVKEINS